MTNPLSGIFPSLGRTVLVTGTDTDVGKSYATAALAVAGWYAGREERTDDRFGLGRECERLG